MTLVLGGRMWVSQARSEVRATVGEFLMWSSSLPYVGRAVSGSPMDAPRAVMVHLPQVLLPLPHALIHHLLVRHLPAADGMGVVLAPTCAASWTRAPHSPSGTAERSGPRPWIWPPPSSHVGPALDRVQPESRTRMLLARIDHFIDGNLTDRTLSPSDVAAHHHLSVRTLHTLFRQRERTEPTIRHRRLEGARAALSNPRLRTLPIRAVAAQWGFTDATLFSRTFRVT
ncbi:MULTISPECIES: helix-turn-helix transcriptional regulator [unclassified Streptomyces]|uniref:helix-turn-helix transcriptional regulator n=1 Tax=Streptomyces sp. NPDC127532 TaxID=3345399 RepID=UPI00363B3A0B